ncbi:hypothetical protein KQH61_00400 [bacterium]|nr:hypothetical protein [bacterium]
MVKKENYDPLSSPDCPPQQHSFLLRCVEVRSDRSVHANTDSEWRFSLQDSKSNTVYNFGDFEGLVAFLQNMLDANISE